MIRAPSRATVKGNSGRPVKMQQAVSQSLYSYWNALRGDRPAPRRFEIEPSHIAHNLPDTFILERVTPANIRFRLAGSRIVDALGIELRGRNLLDLFGSEGAEAVRARMELIASRCAVGIFRVMASNDAGKSAAFEILVMPLTHTQGAVERFLGCVAPIERPSWLGTEQLRSLELVDNDLIWPNGTSLVPSLSADDQPPALPARRPGRIVRSERRQFRVYDGGLSTAVEKL